MAAKCSQCEKPAIGTIGDNPLCLEHFSMMQSVLSRTDVRDIDHMNSLVDEIESIAGVPAGTLPRQRRPSPTPIHTGPMTLNNIKINGSVVGAVNTGVVRQLDVAMSNVRNSGNTEVFEALQKLTQAVMDSREIPPCQHP